MAAMVPIPTALMSVVCFIVLKLTAALLREYKLLKNVRREIAYLKDEMSRINALLVNMDGMEKMEDEEELDDQQEFKSKLRALSRDMEGCIDLSMYQLAEGHAQEGFLDKIKTLFVRHNIAKEIQKLKARWKEESRHGCERYRLNDYFAMPNQLPLVAIDPRLLVALHDEATGLVGIDSSTHKIIRWLTREERQINAVSIVGCGGIGKSTLAKRVYQEIKNQFDCSAFVTVSRSPNMKWVFEEILSGVGYQGNTLLDTEHQLIVKLQEYLKEKSPLKAASLVVVDILPPPMRYLVVIDDIWGEQAWKTISFALLENNPRNRVIITTRHSEIASACLQNQKFRGRMHELQFLNHSDARRLFSKRVFDFGVVDDCPEHLRSTLELIVRKCGGVPLFILSLAGTLANQNVMLVENWENMLSSLPRHGLDTNPDQETMRNMLDLCCRDLSPNIRTCMLYLGMFPGDSIISKDDLVRRWIAEGFVQEAYGCPPEEIAESYFNQLINRNITQVADFNEHGQAISCRVHGVMLDFIISKAVEENFFTIADTQKIINENTEIRRVYFHVDHTKCNWVISSMDLSQIRSLDFWACPACHPSLPRFQLLRVLHLKFADWGHLSYDLTFICKLYLLTYLKITSSHRSSLSRPPRWTCKLPTQIQALQYLKTLDIDANIQGFPEDVCRVTSLSNIIVTSSPPPILPYGVRRLTALQSLKAFSIRGCSVENIQGLAELSNLRELEVHLDAPAEAQAAVINFIRELTRLNALVIHFGSMPNASLRLIHWFLDILPRGLQRLHVHGRFFYSLPDWISQLHVLISLVLHVDELTSDGLGVLARLPSLVHLRLSIGKFVCQPDDSRHRWWKSTQPEATMLICGQMFSCLKSFWFRYDVPCGLMFQQGAMPRLESFGMRFVAERLVAATAPTLTGIEQLQSLTSFTVHIDSSVSGNHQFIDCYNRRRPNAAYYSSCPEEQRWWNLVVYAESFLRGVCSSHPARPRVHIKYGDMPPHMY
ncbi:hypothetical protein ACP4OV_020680 [Aristida adscensionis]